MILDAAIYRVGAKLIENMTRDKTPEERMAMITRLCLASGCHIMLVYYYLAELYGINEEMQRQMDVCQAYYGMVEIIDTSKIKESE